MTDQQPMTPKEAKAQAKAAKAYAKAQRPFWKKKRVIVPAAVVVLIIIVVASSHNSNKAPLTGAAAHVSGSTGTSSTGTVGQTLDVTADGGVAASVTLRTETTTTAPDALGRAPTKGHFVDVDIQIKVTSGQYDFNPLYFKFLASDGNAYDADLGAALSPELDSGTLLAGSTTGGYVRFDVPSTTGTVQLTDALGTVIGSWTV